MFAKILIATRGEIACRIIRTARRMGVATVAVYSDADAGAQHVALADEAWHIGGAAPADSYLLGDRIIAAAQEAGAEAIHPGYGFLSENPDFVDSVTAAGLVFIGPSAEAIRAMGLKDAAKALMADAGVPVVPGYHGGEQGADDLAARAAEIGYPVLIKAVAGGGGKGMRRVDHADDFAGALASAQAEARGAFGNPAVLIEKYISKPRHIEVQVFGDGRDAIHLFERDCSLQRRHQKVIEEAPAPGMTPDLRAAMGDAAVRAARAINYSGAGTVEFIVDASDGLRPDRFWFMEMNTRLQVEHPVTEAITGIDLVEWQLRVAAGEALPARQEDIATTGHAFEARLYAEDVAAGFLPATGRIEHLGFPPGLRADSGVVAGDRISPWYDPMIAKIIVHGPNRAVALRQLARGLDETEVSGTVTNLGFLARLARHPRFLRGDVDTGLIEAALPDLAHDAAPPVTALIRAALSVAGMARARPFTLWQPLRQVVALRHGQVLHSVVIESGANEIVAEVCGGRHVCENRADGWWIDGRKARGNIVPGPGRVTVFDQGAHEFMIPDPLERQEQSAVSADVVLAPMPGLLRDVMVRVGERVAAGERLAILEAMKMEHALTAPREGQVAEVLAQPGAQVEAGASLIRLAPEEDAHGNG
ncbi:acetyl/propionyl/methylcrotonyl-CoA carboxylase subunit alpha [Halodurantibacterium flavum]|uniref:Acetyl/propionyl/methylcrotonyl-CoA carboxylase subunit alpha n=1 Tax=Halodurantibacterium flavum TaxID=1382802 RepID=A0ABW4S9Z4_9RHOB